MKYIGIWQGIGERHVRDSERVPIHSMNTGETIVYLRNGKKFGHLVYEKRARPKRMSEASLRRALYANRGPGILSYL